MKLLRHIANLGYGSRREVAAWFRDGRICDVQGAVLDEGARIAPEQVRLDGEPLDPPPGLVLMLHKPVGYTCSTKDPGRLVYDLLPRRYRYRDPLLSPVGRLDRDTSGLLLFTDDGGLLHRIISPKSHVPKQYDVTLAQDLRGDETALFASGSLLLEAEKTPLLPAEMQVLGPRQARLTLHEGRYHQVRRMFAAVGNHVAALHRCRVGELVLEGLEPGQWRALDAAGVAAIFAAAR